MGRRLSPLDNAFLQLEDGENRMQLAGMLLFSGESPDFAALLTPDASIPPPRLEQGGPSSDGVMPPEVKNTGPSPLAQLAGAATKASMMGLLGMAPAPLAGALNRALQLRTGMFNLTVTNVPGPPNPAHFLEAELADLHAATTTPARNRSRS